MRNYRRYQSRNYFILIFFQFNQTKKYVFQDKIECSVQLKILNEATALPTLNNLSNILKTMLNEADWLIQRCRAEYNMIIYPGADKIEKSNK